MEEEEIVNGSCPICLLVPIMHIGLSFLGACIGIYI